MEFGKVFPELCCNGPYQRLLYCFILMPIQINYYCHIYSHLFITGLPILFRCRMNTFFNHPENLHHSNKVQDEQDQQFNWTMTTQNNRTIRKLISNQNSQKYYYFPWKYSSTNDGHTVTVNEFDLSSMLISVNYSLATFLKKFNPCHQYDAARDRFVEDTNQSNTTIHLAPIIQCSAQGWIHDADANSEQPSSQIIINHSIVSKWNLVCSNEWKQYFLLEVFLIGMVLGFLLHYLLCHNIGYRKTFFLMLVIQCVAGSFSAFVKEFKHFALFRFLLGVSLSTSSMVSTDIMVEIAGVRSIFKIVMFNEIIRLAGSLMLVLISYWIDDFQHVLLALSLPFGLFLFWWWSFPESPHHLLVKGNVDKLQEMVLNMAHTNLKHLDPQLKDSLKRRIHIESAIYKEFKLSSMLKKLQSNRSNHSNIELMDRDLNGSFDEDDDSGVRLNRITSSELNINSDYQIIPLPYANSADKHLARRLQSLNYSGVCDSFGSKTHDCITLNSILKLPNMQRKFIVLLVLASINFSLYVSLNYSILDLLESDSGLEKSSTKELLHYLFTYAIVVSMLSSIVTGLILNRFGRKSTFLVSSLMATLFCLLTGFSMSSIKIHPNGQYERIIKMEKSSLLWQEPVDMVTLISYGLMKAFHTAAFLILVIWSYELLSSNGQCRPAFRTYWALAHIPIILLPVSLYYSSHHRYMTISFPKLSVLQWSVNSSTVIVQYPWNHLMFLMMILTSTLLSLILPETGSQNDPLPSSLQEAEMFCCTLSVTDLHRRSGNPNNPCSNWFSRRALFNFQTPNIRPVGILKNRPSSNPSEEREKRANRSIMDPICLQQLGAHTKPKDICPDKNHQADDQLNDYVWMTSNSAVSTSFIQPNQCHNRDDGDDHPESKDLNESFSSQHHNGTMVSLRRHHHHHHHHQQQQQLYNKTNSLPASMTFYNHERLACNIGPHRGNGPINHINDGNILSHNSHHPSHYEHFDKNVTTTDLSAWPDQLNGPNMDGDLQSLYHQQFDKSYSAQDHRSRSSTAKVQILNIIDFSGENDKEILGEMETYYNESESDQ